MEYILTPRSEIDARIERFQKQMGNLAGSILLESVDMGYFSGTAQDGLIYIPKEGQPVVMVRKSLERARAESPLDVSPLKSFKTLKADLEIPAGAAVGLELDVLPYNNFLRMAKALGDASIVDISETIKQIRSLKSEFEIGLVREACRIVDHGIASIADSLAEGMREIELAGRVELAMRDLGHQGVVRFRRFNHILPMGHLMAGPYAAVPSYISSPTGGKGVSLFHPQGPGLRKIRRNEPVLADFAGVYNGYIADETRIFSLGPLAPELERAHQAALEIEEAIVENLVPGKTGREIFALSEGLGERLGYQDHLGGPEGAKCGFVGHGVGLEIDEYPVLGPVDHLIQASMTIAVEPKMIFPGIGVVGVEDTFLVTSQRAERLTTLAREIWQV